MAGLRQLLTLSVAVALGGNGHADAGAEVRAVEKEPSPVDFQVLSAWRVDFGDQTVVYRKIAPGELPPLPRTEPAPLTPAEAAALDVKSQKSQAFLFLSCTVFDRRVTEMRWEYEGRHYRAFSNIDATYLRGILEFQTEDTVYGLMLGIGEDTEVSRLAAAAAAATRGVAGPQLQPLPAAGAFSQARSEYILAEDSLTAPAAALAAMDALHRYCDAHKADLIAADARREGEERERQRRLREKPPERRTIFIDYWTQEDAARAGLPTKEGPE